MVIILFFEKSIIAPVFELEKNISKKKSFFFNFFYLCFAEFIFLVFFLGFFIIFIFTRRSNARFFLQNLIFLLLRMLCFFSFESDNVVVITLSFVVVFTLFFTHSGYI